MKFPVTKKEFQIVRKEIARRKGEDESITFIKKQFNVFKQAFENGKKIDVGEGFPEDSGMGRELF